MSSNNAPAAFKPKKSVALSGITAGNTALCTVGRSGNDLNYRGYDILDIADHLEDAHLVGYVWVTTLVDDGQRCAENIGPSLSDAHATSIG